MKQTEKIKFLYKRGDHKYYGVFHMAGGYYPATLEDPAEYPEVEIDSYCQEDGFEVDDVPDEVFDYIECGINQPNFQLLGPAENALKFAWIYIIGNKYRCLCVNTIRYSLGAVRNGKYHFFVCPITKVIIRRIEGLDLIEWEK